MRIPRKSSGLNSPEIKCDDAEEIETKLKHVYSSLI